MALSAGAALLDDLRGQLEEQQAALAGMSRKQKRAYGDGITDRLGASAPLHPILEADCDADGCPLHLKGQRSWRQPGIECVAAPRESARTEASHATPPHAPPRAAAPPRRRAGTRAAGSPRSRWARMAMAGVAS